MEITEVKIFPVRDKKLRAFVSIVLDGSFIVNDIKVINGKDGLFISMPSRRRKNGRFKDIAHPLNNETRQAMEQRILAEFQRVTDESEDEARAAAPAAEPREPAAETGAAEPREPAAETGAAEPREPAAEPGMEETDAAKPEPAAADAREPEADDKSLDEVAEAHLSDSYWTT